jgi:hypothetical protein
VGRQIAARRERAVIRDQLHRFGDRCPAEQNAEPVIVLQGKQVGRDGSYVAGEGEMALGGAQLEHRDVQVDLPLDVSLSKSARAGLRSSNGMVSHASRATSSVAPDGRPALTIASNRSRASWIPEVASRRRS